MIKIYGSATCPKCKQLKMAAEKAHIEFEFTTDLEELKQRPGVAQTIPQLETEEGELLDFMHAWHWVKEHANKEA